MPDDDPLAALSAAAKQRAAPWRLASRRLGAAPAHGSRGVYRPGPGRTRKSRLLPILGGIALVVVLLVAAVAITMKVMQQGPPPAGTAAKPKAVDHPPGELFKNVSTAAPGAAASPTPPVDGGQ